MNALLNFLEGAYTQTNIYFMSMLSTLCRKRLRFASHAIWTNQTSLGKCTNLQTTIILKLSYVAFSVLNIRPLDLVLIKKNEQLHSRPQYWNDNEAAPANGGSANKANLPKTLGKDHFCRTHCFLEGLTT